MKFVVIAMMAVGLMIHGAEARTHVTAKVVDEEGYPVSNVVVGISFIVNDDSGPGTKDLDHEGPTDANGIYRASDRAQGAVVVSISNSAYYYASNSGYIDTYGRDKSGKPGWIDPEVTITLRKVGNPVPMYASNLSAVPLPDGDKDFAYDLIVRDWVSPHGALCRMSSLMHIEYMTTRAN